MFLGLILQLTGFSEVVNAQDLKKTWMYEVMHIDRMTKGLSGKTVSTVDMT